MKEKIYEALKKGKKVLVICDGTPKLLTRPEQLFEDTLYFIMDYYILPDEPDHSSYIG